MAMEIPHPTTIGARRRTAEAVIRQAADRWAAGDEELQLGTVVAVFLRALGSDVAIDSFTFDHGSTSPWSGNALGNLPLRPLEAWAGEVSNSVEQLRELAGSASLKQVADCCDALGVILADAATQWRLGDPERPATQFVVTELARALFDYGCFAWWDHRGVRP